MFKKIRATFDLLSLFILLFPVVLIGQTASITEGCVPVEVVFTAPSGQTSFYWEFGNGATSTLANPSNIYVTPNTYEVTLRETLGGAIIGTITIVAHPKPVLTITTDPSVGCRPLAVNFNGVAELPAGVNISNYNWTFGDGGGSTGSIATNYTYQGTGVFDVSLEIETNLETCNTTTIFENQVTVTGVDNVSFATDPFPATACDPPLDVSFINFTAGDNLTFHWDFGNGNTYDGPVPPTQTFTESGDFGVVLTATDENGCTGDVSHPVTIRRAIADFIIRDTVCIGDTLHAFNISDIGSYTWDFPSSVIREYDPDPFVEVFKFTEAGFVEVSLEVLPPEDTCIGRVTKLIYVDDPDATFTLDPSYTCPGPLTVNFTPLSPDPVEWLWLFGDGGGSEDSNPTHEYIYDDQDAFAEYGDRVYEVYLQVTNPSGCTAEYLNYDTISRPDALFLPDSINGCAPLKVMFSDSSRSREDIIRWEYTFSDDGSTEVLLDNGDIEHTFMQPGAYDVQLNIENAAGCVDTSYVVTINVGEQITPDFSVDKTEVCPGEVVHFEDLSNNPDIESWHYSTEGDRSFHCYQADMMDWAFDAVAGPTDVTLTVEIDGCYSSVTKEDLITVKGPIAHIYYENDCEDHFGVTFRDSSSEATVLSWDFGDGSTGSGAEVRHTYSNAGDYMVVLTAENPGSGCAASMDTAIVFIRDIRASFELPDSICRGETLGLDASGSSDVDKSCWRGHEWLFDISDRPIATQEELIDFTFNTPGEETVTLIVTDINGCEDTLVNTLEIFDISANYTTSTEFICSGGDIPFVFTDASFSTLPIVSWNWNFGDGTTSDVQNPMHNFDAIPTDTFPISLEVENSLGCKSTSQKLFIRYEPVSQIATDPVPPNICLGENIALTATDYTLAGSHLNYSWDFGNETGSNAQATMVTYDEIGNYNIVLTYEEAATGCGGEENVLVGVQEAPISSFTTSVDGQGVICYPENIEFTNESTSTVPLSFAWNFGNGQMSVVSDPAVAFNKGTWEVQLIASTAFGCRDTSYQSITLVGPEGDFTFDPPAICRGGEITFTTQDLVDVNDFTWNFGDGTEESNVSPVSHVFDLPTNTTIVTLKMEGEDGACTAAVVKEISIGGAIADFLINGSDDTAFCETDLVFTNTSLGTDTYAWDFGNGQTSIQENPSMTFAPGETTIRLIASNSSLGCIDTIEKVIQVAQLPDLEIMDAVICAGDSLELSLVTDFDNGVYTWGPAELLYSISDKKPQTRALTENTTFTLTVLDTIMGCDGTISKEIKVIQEIEWMSVDTASCRGTDITSVPLPPNEDEAYIFSWSPSAPPFHIEDGQESAAFTLNISDIGGCFDQDYTYNVKVLGAGDVQFPNVFTPNKDGVNDIFKPFFNPGYEDQVEVVDFRVFNRWGQLVFEGNDTGYIWDGMFKGQPGASDVYIFSCEIRLDCGTSTVYSGEVTLLR